MNDKVVQYNESFDDNKSNDKLVECKSSNKILYLYSQSVIDEIPEHITDLYIHYNHNECEYNDEIVDLDLNLEHNNLKYINITSKNAIIFSINGVYPNLVELDIDFNCTMNKMSNIICFNLKRLRCNGTTASNINLKPASVNTNTPNLDYTHIRGAVSPLPQTNILLWETSTCSYLDNGIYRWHNADDRHIKNAKIIYYNTEIYDVLPFSKMKINNKLQNPLIISEHMDKCEVHIYLSNISILLTNSNIKSIKLYNAELVTVYSQYFLTDLVISCQVLNILDIHTLDHLEYVDIQAHILIIENQIIKLEDIDRYFSGILKCTIKLI